MVYTAIKTSKSICFDLKVLTVICKAFNFVDQVILRKLPFHLLVAIYFLIMKKEFEKLVYQTLS